MVGLRIRQRNTLCGVCQRLIFFLLALTCNVGLADTLQSELMLYGVDVHIFFPGVMFTPGLEEENKMKPQIVKKIEGVDDGLTAEQAALALLKGE